LLYRLFLLILFFIHFLLGRSQFYAGDLGPSTIVGSAAFNLLMITAACITAIPSDSTPDGRTGLRGVRSIADMGVFSVTCTWGIFAYVWLLIILLLPPTPNVCSFYEGLLTFLFFPITVQMAYMADIGMFSKTKVTPQSKIVGADGMSSSQVDHGVELLKKLDGLNLSDEEKAKLMVSMSKTNKPSRAQLRMQATRMMTGGKRVLAPPPNKSLLAKFAKGNGGPTFFFGDVDGNYCTKCVVILC
jgi:solute carrier family 8 (sodium/calcium exchanger)